MNSGMVQEDRYIASHRPYLLSPSSLRTVRVYEDDDFFRSNISALWFRKKNGQLLASFGQLWHYSHAVPTFNEFVANFDSGRYGGSPIAQWNYDERVLWTPSKTTVGAQEGLIQILDPIAANFPEIPEGWVGWFDIREK